MADVTLIASDTKRTLLQLMKRRGEITLDDAIDATGYARTTLREHLNQLERDGLVQRRSERQGRGRPRLRYRITARGERLFPTRDGVLLRELLRHLKAKGEEELIAEFFESFWARRVEEVKHRIGQAGGADDLERKLEVLEAILREEGFMPEIQIGDEGLVIRECNCPFAEAVKQTKLPCRLEAKFYGEIFDVTIERTGYLPDGDAACTYAVDIDASG
jgi:predicted ArsR family transcriptional regulator